MKTNKACGPNSIATNTLELFKKEFSKPLSDMINKSFHQGVFPNILKIANVIPILKKVDKLDCNNYRPGINQKIRIWIVRPQLGKQV